MEVLAWYLCALFFGCLAVMGVMLIIEYFYDKYKHRNSP